MTQVDPICGNRLLLAHDPRFRRPNSSGAYFCMQTHPQFAGNRRIGSTLFTIILSVALSFGSGCPLLGFEDNEETESNPAKIGATNSSRGNPRKWIQSRVEKETASTADCYAGASHGTVKARAYELTGSSNIDGRLQKCQVRIRKLVAPGTISGPAGIRLISEDN